MNIEDNQKYINIMFDEASQILGNVTDEDVKMLSHDDKLKLFKTINKIERYAMIARQVIINAKG